VRGIPLYSPASDFRKTIIFYDLIAGKGFVQLNISRDLNRLGKGIDRTFVKTRKRQFNIT
jgi:hypothetical protein